MCGRREGEGVTVEHFLCLAPTALEKYIHYSCERQVEHAGKLAFAPDLTRVINGTSVAGSAGGSGPLCGKLM